MENPVFDLSKNSESAKFEKLLISKDWVNGTVNWYIEKVRRMHREGVQYEDLLADPIANRVNFPGNLNMQLMGYSLGSFENAMIISSRVNRDPNLVLLAPVVPRTESPIDRMLDNPERMAQYGTLLKNFKSDGYEQRRAEKRARIIKDNLPQALELERMMGFRLGELNYDQLSVISGELQQAKGNLIEALYYKYAIDRAVETIKEIIPSLRGVADNILDNLIITSSTLKDGFFASGAGSLHSICFPKRIIIDRFESDHARVVKSAGHEVLHNILTEMLGVGLTPPGGVNRSKRFELTLEEIEKYLKRRSASFYGVILEGVSISYEYELYKKVVPATVQKSSLKQFIEASMNRIKNFRENNRYLNEIYRQKQIKNYDPSRFDPANMPSFTYGEGARLAIALRRGGFGINDIPEIVKLIEIEVANVTGKKYDPEMLMQIGISKDPDSHYQKIIRNLRSKKKNI